MIDRKVEVKLGKPVIEQFWANTSGNNIVPNSMWRECCSYSWFFVLKWLVRPQMRAFWCWIRLKLECGSMPNVMAALPNIRGSLCSTPQSLADAHYCRAVTLPRRETHWDLQGCPKLMKQSQPLVGQCSPYYKDMWRRYCCLRNFFPIVDTCLSCEDTARQSCAMVPRLRFFASFLRPVLPASRMQHISDLHSKSTLRPHHVLKYGRHPLCDRWD